MEESPLDKVILVTRILERSKGREKEIQALVNLLDTASTSLKNPRDYIWNEAKKAPSNTVVLSNKTLKQIKQLTNGYVKFFDSILHRLDIMFQYVPVLQQNHDFKSLRKKYEKIQIEHTETNRKLNDLLKQITVEYDKTQLMANVERSVQDFIVKAKKNMDALMIIESKVQQQLGRIQAQLISEIEQMNKTERSTLLQDTNELMKVFYIDPYGESQDVKSR